MPTEGLVSKTIAGSLCLTAVFSLWSTAFLQLFGFIPAHTFYARSYLWNIVSYIIVEPSIILCACSVAYMLTIGKRVEAAVGTFAFLRIVVLTGIATAVTLLVLSVILYQVGFLWFFQCFCGVWPAAAALLVSWVAASPLAGVFSSWASVRVQRRHVPTTLLAFALIVDLVFRGRHEITENNDTKKVVLSGSAFITTSVGFCVSWALQRHLFLESPVDFCVLFYPIASKCLGQYNAGRQQDDDPRGGSSLTQGVVSIPVLRGVSGSLTLLPGSTEEEAERRRAIAMAALNSRLQDDTLARPGGPKGDNMMLV